MSIQNNKPKSDYYELLDGNSVKQKESINSGKTALEILESSELDNTIQSSRAFRAIVPGMTGFEYAPYDDSYIKGYKGEEELEDYVANNQSTPQAIVNGIIRSAISIAPKVLHGFGTLLGTIPAIATGSMDPMYDNAITNAMSDFEEYLKEAMPVYSGSQYSKGSLLQQMGTAEFWAGDVADAFAFAASAFVGGAVTKPLQMGAKATKLLSGARVMSTAEKSGKLGSKFIKALKAGEVGKQVDLATMTAYNVITEGAFEAAEMNRTLKEEYAQLKGKKLADYSISLDEQFKDFPLHQREQMKKEALDTYAKELDAKYDKRRSEAARNVYLGNMVALTVPNYIQSRMFHGGTKRTFADITKAIRKNGAEEVSKGVNYWKNLGVNASQSLISEPFEENAQLAIQNVEKALFHEPTDDNRLGLVFDEMLNNFTTLEGQKSMVLGAIVGGGMSMYSSLVETKGERDMIKNADKAVKQQAKDLHAVGNFLSGELKNHLKKYTVEDDRYTYDMSEDGKTFTRTDKEGNVENISKEDYDLGVESKERTSYLNPETESDELTNDQQKIERALYSLTGDKNIFDAALQLSHKQDEYTKNILDNIALARGLFKTLSEYKSFSSLEEAFELFNELTFDNIDLEDVDATGKLSKFKGIANKMFDDYKRLAEEISNLEEKFEDKSESASMFFNDLFASAFYNSALGHVRESALEFVSQDKLVEARENNDIMKEDTEKYLNKLSNSKHLKKLYSEYMSSSNVQALTSKIAELKKKPERTKEDNKELNRLEYLLSEEIELNNRQQRFDINKPASRIDKNSRLGYKDQYYVNKGRRMIAKAKYNDLVSGYINGENSIDELNAFLKNNRSFIDEKDISRVKEITSKMASDQTAIKTQIEELQKLENNKRAEANDWSMEPDAESQAEATRLRTEAGQIAEERAVLENSLIQLEEKSNSIIQSLESKDDVTLERKLLKELTADEYAQYKVLEHNHKKISGEWTAFDLNKDTYSDVEAFIQAIKDANKVISTYESKERESLLNKKEFDVLVTDILRLKDKLEANMKTVESNMSNKDAKDYQSSKDDDVDRMTGIGLSKDGAVEDSQLYEELVSISDDNSIEDVKENASGKLIKSYIKKFYDSLRGKRKENVKVIDKRIQSIISEVFDYFISNGYYKRGVHLVENDYYRNNPVASIYALLNQMIKIKTGEVLTNEDSFVNDLYVGETIESVKKTVSNLSNDVVYKEDVLHVLGLHQKIVGLTKLRNSLASDVSERELVDKVEDFVFETLAIEDNPIYPTRQQKSVFMSIVRFLSLGTKTKGRTSDLMLFAKGLAGTGKTKVVLKYAMKLAGIKKEDIVALGHNVKSTENVNDALGTTALADTDATNIKDVKIEDNVKVLVVDEIAGLSIQEINAILFKVRDINIERAEKKIEPLRLISLGDPTQITKSTLGLRPDVIDLGMDKRSGFTNTDALDVVYRSDDSAILRVQDLYKNQYQEVSGVSLQNTKKDGNNYGVRAFYANEDIVTDIDRVLENQKETGEKRTTVVIVDSQEKADYYNNKLSGKGVDVVYYVEAQGFEWDNVYIDISRSNQTFGREVDYNTAMYTMTSRAKKSLNILDYTESLTNNDVNRDIDDFAKGKETLLIKNHDAFIEDHQGDVYVFGLKTKTQKPDGKKTQESKSETKPEEKEITEEDTVVVDEGFEEGDGITKDDVKKNKDDEVNKEEPVVIGKKSKKSKTGGYVKNGVHTLRHPSNANLKTGDAYSNKEGDEVFYIKVEKQKADGTGSIEQFHIISQRTEKGTPIEGGYQFIGMLSKEEIEELFPDTFVEPVSLSAAEGSMEKGKIYKMPTGWEKAVLGKGKISYASSLSYNYDESSYTSGKGTINKILKKVQSIFSSNSGSETIKGMRIKIFTDSETREMRANKEGDFYAGVPYLFFDMETKNGNKIRSQFVRLNPRLIKKNDAIIQNIKSYRNHVANIEKKTGIKLGTKLFGNLVSDFSRGWKIEDGKVVLGTMPTFKEISKLNKITEDQYNVLAEEMKSIIPLLYGRGRVKKTSTYADWKAMYKTSVKDGIVTIEDETMQFVPEVASEEIDDDTIGTWTTNGKTSYVDGLKYGGPAVVDFNKIARTNKFAGGREIRSARIVTDSRGKTKKVITGKSLISSNENNTYAKKILVAIARKHATKIGQGQNMDFSNWEYERLYNLVKDLKLTTEEELNRIDSMVIKPMDINVLDSIVGDNMFDENGEYADKTHTGLMLPITIGLNTGSINNMSVNKETIDEIESQVSTYLTDITPTEIQVEVDKKFKPEVKPISEAPTVKRTSRRDVKTRGSRRLEVGKALNKNRKLTIKEAIKEFSRLLPNASEEELTFLTDRVMESLEGKKIWGRYKSGIVAITKFFNGEETLVHEEVLRHEVFHKIWNEYILEKDKVVARRLAETEDASVKGMDAIQFEEWLAHKFQKIHMGEVEKTNIFKRLYQSIMKLLGLHSDIKSIDELFNRIENNYYTRKLVEYPSIDTRYLIKDIVAEFGNETNFIGAVNALDEYIEDRVGSGVFLDGDDVVYPSTLNDAIAYVKDMLANDFADMSLEEVLETEDANEIADYYLYKNFDKLVADKYPKLKRRDVILEVNEKDLVDEDILDKIDKSRDVNLTAHVLSNEEKDTQLNASSRLTYVLSNLISPTTKKYINSKAAYVRGLKTFMDFDASSIQIMRRQIANKMIGADHITKALLIELERQLGIIYDKKSTDVLVPNKTMKFIGEDVFIYSTDNSDIQDIISVRDIENDKRNIKVILRKDIRKYYGITERGDVSTAQFIKGADMMMKRSALEPNIQDIVDLFNFEIAKNTVVELLSHFKSHRERNIMVGRVNYIGGMKVSYVVNKASDSYNIAMNRVRQTLKSSIGTKEQWDKFKKSELPKYNKKGVSNAKKGEMFIDYLGFDELAKATIRDNAGFAVIGKSLSDFVEYYSKEFNKKEEEWSLQNHEEQAEQLESEEVETTVDLSYILTTGSSALLRDIVDALDGLYVNEDRPTTVLGADKKRKYTMVTSTFVHDVVKKINLMFGGLKKGDYNLPAYFKTKFFQFNPFANGNKRIYNYVDHDGIDYIKRSGESSVDYASETNKEYFSRTFGLYYIGGILNSSSSNPKYIQAPYTPSDRPTPGGFTLGIDSKDKVKDDILFIVKQIKARPKEYNKIVDGYNENNYSGFDIINKVLKGADINSMSETELVNKIVSAIKERAKETAEILNNAEAEFDSSIVDRFYKNNELSELAGNFLGLGVGEKSLIKALDYIKGKKGKFVEFENGEREFKFDYNEILPIVEHFVFSDTINSYFVTQLIAGDAVFYGSHDKLIKRLQTVFSPRRTPVVNNEIGIKPKSRVLVLDDVSFYKEDGQGNIREFFEGLGFSKDEINEIIDNFPKDYQATDGFGFMSPKRRAELQRGYGQGENVGTILKPVLFDILEDGEYARPVIFKYASAVITDDLANRFKSLGKIRSAMEANGIEEVIFNSGVKVGNPAVTTDVNELIDNAGNFKVDEQSIININNENYGLQLDPEHEVDSKVANPSQLTSFLRTLESGKNKLNKAYKSMSRLIELGNEKFSKLLDKNGFAGLIAKTTQDSNNSRLGEMASNGVSMNIPAFTTSALLQLSNLASRLTVGIRYRGSKLVLQPSLGATRSIDLTEEQKNERRELIRKHNPTASEEFVDELLQRQLKTELRYVNKDGRRYAEMILPHGLLPKKVEEEINKALRERRDTSDMFEYADLLGFRIPSSDMHSAVAIKVVGFYDSKGTNVVIAPKELVPLHGSDFDVDSLFVLSRKHANKNNYGFSTEDPVGYIWKDGKYEFNYNYVEEVLEPLREENTDEKVNDFINTIEEAYHQNLILESFLDEVTAERNKMRMYMPISTEVIDKYIDSLSEIAGKNVKDRPYDLTNIKDRRASHKSSFDGKGGIGTFANFIKFTAISLRTGELVDGKQTNPKLIDAIDENGKVDDTKLIKIDGKVYDELTDNTKVFEELDALMNSSTDNVKLQQLPIMNLSGKTMNAFSALLTLGVNFDVAANIMQQPVVKLMFNNVSENKIRRVFRNNVKEYKPTELFNISSTDLVSSIKKNYGKIETLNDFSELTEEELLLQSKIFTLFKYADSVGSNMMDVSKKYYNIIRSMPALIEDIDTSLEIIDDIDNSIDSKKKTSDQKFNFAMPRLLEENPHLKSAVDVLRKLRIVANNNIVRDSKLVVDFAQKVSEDIGFNLFDNKDSLNNLRIREEFIKYVMSAKYDYTTEPTYNHNGRELSGEQAFIGNMADIADALIAYNRENKLENTFLNKLDVFSGRKRMKSIKFNGGNTVSNTDVARYVQGFKELRGLMVEHVDGKWVITKNTSDAEFSNIQEKLMQYLVVKDGIRFGKSSYALYMPVGLYKGLDDSIKMLENASKNEFSINKLKDNFILHMLSNNAEQVKGYFGDVNKYLVASSEDPQTGISTKKYSYSGMLKDGTRYDISFKMKRFDNNEKIEDAPNFISRTYKNVPSLYYKVGETSSAETGSEFGTAYYVRIGIKNYFNTYGLTQDVIKNGYDTSRFMKSYNRTLAVPVLEDEIITIANSMFTMKEAKNKFKKENLIGEFVNVHNYSDIARVNGVIYQIEEIRGGKAILRKLKTKKGGDITISEIKTDSNVDSREKEHGAILRKVCK